MKNLITLLLLSSTLVLVNCGGATEPVEPTVTKPEVRVQIASTGLKQSITVPGTVKAVKEANISADAKATVIQLPAKIGDTVQKGQLLMVLGSDDVNTRLTNANISYGTAIESLNQTKQGNTQSIASAELNLQIARNNLEKLLTENKARKDQAQEQYNSALLNNNLSVEAAELQAQNIAETTQNTIANALAAANVIVPFSTDQELFNFTNEVHIGVTNPTLRRTTETALRGLESRNRIAQSSIANSLDIAQYAESTFTDVLAVLNNSVTGADYTQTQLNTDIATISNRLSAIQNLKSQITSAQANVNSAKQQAAGGSQVELNAQAQLDATLAQLATAESQSRLAVEQAEQNVELAKSQAASAEISAKTALNSIGNELRNVNTSLNELRITAPFAGKVQRIDVSGGEEVNVGQSLITLEGEGSVKIVAQLNAIDRQFVTTGTPARIDGSVTTTVSAISPSADPVTKKYTVELLVPNNTVRIGEFVDVQFETTVDVTVQSIFVPITAVHIDANQTYVWTAAETSTGVVAQKTPVVLGDIVGRYIQVESGIATGQSIVIEGNRSLKTDNTLVTITQ